MDLGPKEKNEYQPKINNIRRVIYSEDKRLREKYAWLEHQNAIGVGFFLGSITCMIIVSYLHICGFLAWYYTIPLMAFLISLLHELEHDLIHDLYFKEKPWLQNIMFFSIWLSKINANPWWRKAMHLKHHKTSGQIDDIEERLIGLGLPLGIKRFLVTISPMGSYLQVYGVSQDSKKMKSLPGLDILRASIINLPVLLPGNICLIVVLCQFFELYPIPPTIYIVCWYVCMLLYYPNTLRQSCLQWVSTGCHYFGDIPANNVYFQNQILDHPIFYPLQFFCFNFGATHIIHHYVTRQPFYLRQMCAPPIVAEMKKQGVRFNDLQIYKRNHRFKRAEDGNFPNQLSVGA